MPFDFSSGFQTSQTEVLIFASVVGGLVILLILGRVIRRHGGSSDSSETLNKFLSTPGSYVELSADEQSTLDHLAWTLKDPKKKGLLRSEPAIFRRAARRAVREGIVASRDVQRLADTLEIELGNTIGGRTSTGSLPTGAAVTVADSELNTVGGHVLLSDDTALRIKIDRGRNPFGRGTNVEVVCQSENGMYRFVTPVVNYTSKEISLKHTTRVEQVQRRRYRRKPLQLPVDLSPLGIDTKPRRSKTHDVSIGGAAIKNPRRHFITGMQLSCVLSPDSRAQLSVTGTVVRTSKRGKVLHVRFNRLTEQMRHHLFRQLFDSYVR